MIICGYEGSRSCQYVSCLSVFGTGHLDDHGAALVNKHDHARRSESGDLIPSLDAKGSDSIDLGRRPHNFKVGIGDE